MGLWQQQAGACRAHTLLAMSVSSMSVTTTLRSAAAAACTGAVRSGARAATHRAGAGTATKPCAAEQNNKSTEHAPGMSLIVMSPTRRAEGRKFRRVTALPPLDMQEMLFAFNCWKRARRCASTRRSILVPARTPQCTPRALGSASPSHRPVPVGRAAPAPCVLRHPDTSSHHGPPPPSLPQRRAAASFCRCSS